MAIFRYTAYEANGTLAEGTLEATDRGDAARLLSAQRLQPVTLEVEGGAAKAKTRAKENKKEAKEKTPEVIRLRPAQVVMFVEELADLLRGGIQLDPALGIMERRKELSKLKDAAKRVREKLRDGQSFAQAIQSTSPSFGEMFCSLAAAGEISGTLPVILSRQADYLKKIQELKGKVLFALIYPAFLAFSALAVSILFVVFLIPKLMELLDSTGGTLPAGAQFILNLSQFAQQTWWIFLIGGIVIFLAVRLWAKAEKNRPAWDRFCLSVPLIGKLLRERFYVQFLETVSNLVSNGLPLNKALELTRRATPNRYLRNQLANITIEVADGAPLSHSLERTQEFPSLLIDMIVVGEETGELAPALERAAERYDKSLNQRAEKLGAMIQPAVVILMATLVGAMAYLMITAIFQTISGLGG